MGEATAQITIPERIYSELEAEVNTTQFDNVDEYTTYVFEELIHYFDDAETDANIADQDQLKERLESLGYIQDD